MLQNVVVADTIKKISDLNGTQRLSVAIFLWPPQSSISTANLIQSTPSHFFKTHFNNILLSSFRFFSVHAFTDCVWITHNIMSAPSTHLIVFHAVTLIRNDGKSSINSFHQTGLTFLF